VGRPALRYATADHDGPSAGAWQPQALQPLGQAALSVNINAHEAVGVTAALGDQQACGIEIWRYHRSYGMAAAIAAKHREADDMAASLEDDCFLLGEQPAKQFAALDIKGMNPQTERLVTRSLRDFRRAGVDKDEQTRTRVKAIDDG